MTTLEAAAVSLSTGCLCVTDLTGRLLWTNDRAADLLGFPAPPPAPPGGAPLSGAPAPSFFDHLHPDDAAAVTTAWDALASGTEVTGLLARVLSGDGAVRSVDWTLSADTARGVVHCAGRDATDDHEAAQRLRDDEAILRAILDHSPASIYVKDLHGRYLLVNRQWSRVTGIPAEAAVGATASASWPADAAAIAVHERALLRAGEPQVTDDRMHARAGVRDFRVSRFLLYDDNGSPYAMGGIATDITARTEAERTLAGRERLLATVLQASPDIITLLDRDGSVQQVSSADGDVLGSHYQNQPATADLRSRVHPDDHAAVAAAFSAMVDGATPLVRVRFRVLHTDGHWVTLDSRGQALYDEAGAFAGAVIVSRDMTARILSEHRLRDAREAAERASRTKSEFLSRMSHELRTPLNAILGFAQLLQMDDLPPERAEAVDHILRAGRHLLDLIDEVLDIARIESGHLDLLIEDVVVSAIVADAVELTRPMAQAASLTVNVVVDPAHGVLLRADRQRLLQVLLNLLSNAVKYNYRGGRVDVSTAVPAPGRIRLVVADTGRGIAAEHVDRVFTPFDRLGAELSGIEGSGVGLALCRHLVERMGGRIGFESVPGIGTAFYVELDTATPQAAPRPPSPPGSAATPPADFVDGEVGPLRRRGAGPAVGSAHPANVAPVPGSSAAPSFRVLLVEDDVANLELVERVLSRRPGIELLAALHGGLGIELACQHRPDLILVDLDLPDLPGTTVIDRLGRIPVTAAIPVAVVGSDTAGPEVRALLGQGVVGLLTKPFDVQALLTLVDAVRFAGSP